MINRQIHIYTLVLTKKCQQHTSNESQQLRNKSLKPLAVTLSLRH